MKTEVSSQFALHRRTEVYSQSTVPRNMSAESVAPSPCNLAWKMVFRNLRAQTDTDLQVWVQVTRYRAAQVVSTAPMYLIRGTGEKCIKNILPLAAPVFSDEISVWTNMVWNHVLPGAYCWSTLIDKKKPLPQMLGALF